MKPPNRLLVQPARFFLRLLAPALGWLQEMLSSITLLALNRGCGLGEWLEAPGGGFFAWVVPCLVPHPPVATLTLPSCTR